MTQKNKKYTNMEILKIAIENKTEIDAIARRLYLTMPWNYTTALARTINLLTGEDKQLNVNMNDDVGNELYTAIREIWRTNLSNELTKVMNCKGTNGIIKKRLKKLRMIIKKVEAKNFNFYTQIYNPTIKSFQSLREGYRSNDVKIRMKREFLRYIENMDITKQKQSKRYTISRDLDKDAYYETVDGRIAKIKRSLLQKYMKKGDINEYMEATKTIPEGIYVKPMRLINKTIPKVQESYKLLIASLFEGLKECHMVIDTDFKTAYEPIYQNHQDTDGDKASNYSCMSGEGERAQEFYGKIHGCKVVRWETDDGEQVGRCIMYEWNGRRHFIRIYGSYDYHRTMIDMLEAQMKEGDLFGRNCKLDHICLNTDLDWDSECMYLDGNRYGIKEEDGSFYMVADHYDCDCKTTGGDTLESMLEDSSTCERCGRRRNSDDGVWVNDYFYCCIECAEEDGWRCCERCGEWEREDDCIYIDGAGYYCCEECANRDGYAFDTYYNEWTKNEELGKTDDGEYYTTREGAAEYYGVEENEVKWDDENGCWGRPRIEQEQTEETKKGENND